MIGNKPDDVDYKIMNLLQQDARIEISKLAGLVYKSPTPVTERIRKLQEAGFIKGYLTLLDRAQIGLPVLVVALVKLDKQTKTLLKEFEATAGQMPEVQFLLHLSGEWDFVLHITATTPQAYYDFLMERLCDQPNVAHVESAFVLKECKSYGPFRL